MEFEDAQLPGETGDAEGWRELKSREETQTIQSYVFGGERMMGLWTLSGQVGYSQSRERNPVASPARPSKATSPTPVSPAAASRD